MQEIMQKLMRKEIIFLTALILAAPALTENSSGVSSYCNDPSSWPAGQTEAYKKRCERMVVSLENVKKEKARRSAWIKAHGKSDLMAEIFKNHNDRIPDETATAEEISWIYKTKSATADMAQCKEFLFGTAGDLKSRRVFDCE